MRSVTAGYKCLASGGQWLSIGWVPWRGRRGVPPSLPMFRWVPGSWVRQDCSRRLLVGWDALSHHFCPTPIVSTRPLCVRARPALAWPRVAPHVPQDASPPGVEGWHPRHPVLGCGPVRGVAMPISVFIFRGQRALEIGAQPRGCALRRQTLGPLGGSSCPGSCAGGSFVPRGTRPRCRKRCPACSTGTGGGGSLYATPPPSPPPFEF